MSTTTTASFSFTVDNTTGNLYYKIRRRLSGDTAWTQVTQSGDTVDISGLEINRLYDFQVVNVNGGENPASAVTQSINITNPNPEFYPTNVSIGLDFTNLSEDIDAYALTIAESSTPAVIIESTTLYPVPSGDTLDYEFTGLDPVTSYLITIAPSANQFINTFSYTVVTEAFANCAAPNNVTATLS